MQWRPLLFALILLTSCSGFFKKKTERSLARVYDDYLFESDLKGVVPPDISAKDSIMMVKSYVDNWVRQRLILHQAEKNLQSSQLDFSKQLENYKNSLIIFEYENQLIHQKLDTVVTDEEISNYYNTNPNTFLVRDNIVRIQYAKLPLKSKFIPKVRILLLSDKPDDRNKLADLCEQQSFGYFIDDQKWIFFTDLMNLVPLRPADQTVFLNKNRQVEVNDQTFTYLIRFRDYRLRDSNSPLELEKQKIQDIILNRRKMELLGKMHEYIYQNAQKQNDFEVF
ncbi:MAG: hypothetical protein NTY96_05550 [Bacteroidetes bacterium]|nr:hypothetical protein [Bacteroidota bacterium]